MGLSFAEAAQPVDVEICGIMTHPPRIYVEWVRASIALRPLEVAYRYSGREKERIALEAARAEVEELFEILKEFEANAERRT